MKLKALLLACAVAGAGASFAMADGGHDGDQGDHHGRHHHGTTTTTTTMTTTTTTAPTTTTTPAGCMEVELRGTFVTVSATSFTFKVDRVDADNDNEDDNDDNNNAADALVGTTITVAVDANTRVEFKATGTLIGPNVGDTAKVKAEMCGTPATFTADKVKAKGAKPASTSSNLKRSSKHHGSKSHK